MLVLLNVIIDIAGGLHVQVLQRDVGSARIHLPLHQ